MSGFLYYFPGKVRPDLSALEFPHRERVSLPVDHNIIDRGPDGGAGWMVAIDERHLAHRITTPAVHQAAAQRWTNVGRWWVGMHATTPPGPSDLRLRVDLPTEHRVRLRDGREWELPAIVDPMGRALVPRVYGWGPDGPTDGPDQRYQAIVEEAVAMAARWRKGRDCDVTVPEALAFVARAMGLLYAVTETELRLLGLFGDEEISAAFKAAIDVPTLLEMQKKTDPPPLEISASPG